MSWKPFYYCSLDGPYIERLGEYEGVSFERFFREKFRGALEKAIQYRVNSLLERGLFEEVNGLLYVTQNGRLALQNIEAKVWPVYAEPIKPRKKYKPRPKIEGREQRIKEALELYNKTGNARATAEKVGVSIGTIYRWYNQSVSSR